MKRKRGGQPGNQNARRHGFFSETLTPEEIQCFWDIVRHQNKSPEVALVYAKAASSLRLSPGNPVVLDEAATLLAKLSAVRTDLNRTQSRELKKAILAFWENSGFWEKRVELSISEPIEAEENRERKYESSAL